MKITIIGGGNMGGAMARGLVQEFQQTGRGQVRVCDLNAQVLENLQSFNPHISTTAKAQEVIPDADIVVLALKPWLVTDFIKQNQTSFSGSTQLLVSVAAGVSLQELASAFDKQVSQVPTLFRVIPNTAISYKESMSFVSSLSATQEQINTLQQLLEKLGSVMVVPESLLVAGTALASCGIAYGFRYIRAAMEAGVEAGFAPDMAKEIVLQTLQGAIAVLRGTGNHPEEEIDKVTTPGGLTIKGLHAMEQHGFSHAVVQGIKAALT